MPPDPTENSKTPPAPREGNPYDDDEFYEVVVNTTSGDEVDDDDLDDQLERGGRAYVSYELEDEDTLPRSV